jgi:type IV secretory pathway component VirB8
MAESQQPAQPSIYEEITANVRSGQYFKDAVDWYSIKYIQPVTHRSFFILITTFSVLFSLAAFYILNSILPIVEELPIVVENESMVDDYLHLKKLGNEFEDPNVSVIRYLTGKYIAVRETYDFDKIQSTLAFINAFSSPEEYQKHVNYMKPETPESPILRYRNHTKRIATISKEGGREMVTLIKDPNLRLPPNVHRLVAFFTAKEAGPVFSSTTAWKVSLDVRFSDVVFYKDKQAFSPMDFMVTRYELEQVVNKQ